VTAADRALQKTDARGYPELAAYDEDGDPSSSALNSGLDVFVAGLRPCPP
jgi:hypothetical protein